MGIPEIMFLSLIALTSIITIGIIVSICRMRTEISTNGIQILLTLILGVSDLGCVYGIIKLCLVLAPSLVK